MLQVYSSITSNSYLVLQERNRPCCNEAQTALDAFQGQW